MRVLFIGGTGNISTASTRLAVERGIDVTLLTRGQRSADIPAGVHTITTDIENESLVAAALGNQTWDAVVDWIAFTPDQIERDIRLFRDRTRQFIFISSASAYQRPVGHYLITESTPLANPFWQYSRDKIACEDLLTQAYREHGFPITIVRPSLTYGDTQIVLAVNSWQKSYTAIDRMRRGKKVIVPGDGSSLWVITHNSDFAQGLVGLLGHQQAIGHAFHITSVEVLTWNQIYETVAAAAGAPPPRLVHIASDYITACLPEFAGGLLGDKAYSSVFDNTKIKRFVPDFVAPTRFRTGMARSIAWFDADPARQQVDAAAEAAWDKLIAGYERGLADARREFGR